MATTAADSVQAVLRLRTLGPSGLNPPQIEVIDRLQTLTEDGPITNLDIDVWGGSMGITQMDDRDPGDTRELVADFRQWADEQGYSLRPAFEWRSTEPEDTEGSEIVTPLITLAVYTGDTLRAVYPSVGGADNDVNTIYDGIEALESMARDTEHTKGGDSQHQERPNQLSLRSQRPSESSEMA